MAKDELAEIPWLIGCTARERDALRRRADIIDLPAGTTLTSEGEASRWFYAVLDGQALVCRNGAVVGRFGAGDPVNEVAVLRNEAADATVTTETPVRVLAMGRREFLGALDDTPGLTRRLLLPHIASQPEASPSRRPTLVPMSAA